MYRNLLLSCFSAALFSLLLINSAQAQYRGSLQGTVSDPAGALIPGADVTLTNRETNQSMHAQTGDSGAYAFNSLPPSSYTLVVEKSGFKRKQLDNVSLIAEQANSANVQLDIGDAGQTITVNGAEAPLIDTETAIISGTVDAQQIQKMPSFGRDVFQLVQLAPGAFGDASQSAGGGSSNLPNQAGPGGSSATSGIFQTENKPQVVANGSPMESNNITIDGVGVTSISWGGSAVVTPNEESVKEVKVVTNNYDAEYGRYSGAQIQVISKNGTNDFHGSLFLRAHRPGLNAYQRWNGPNSIWTPTNQTPQQRGLQRDEARFNQLGGSVGGPIWKNKIFGFFSIEAVKNNSTNFGTGWYETPQFDALAGATVASQFLAFPGEGASFSSILPATCSSIGLTEGTNCATTGQGLDVGSPLSSAPGTQDPGFTNAGSPGVGGGLDGVADIMDVTTVNPTTNTERQYNGRIDFNVSSKDLVALSMYRVPVSSTFFNGPIRSANLWHHKAVNEAETALWNHTFSPTLANEARVNAAGWRWNEISTNPQEPWGLPAANIWQFNAPGNNSYGTAPLQALGAPGPSVFDQWTYNAKDTLTKVYKSHLLKMGGEVTRLQFLDEAPWSARPTYNFNNLWDFLNDAPSAESGNFDPLTGLPTSVRKDLRSTILGFFAQDAWKVRPTLTINLGLRWEYFGSFSSKQENLSTVNLGSGANVLTGMSLRRGGSLYEAPKTNFGPQIGFAWTPAREQGKTVIRGGFGIGYTGLEAAVSLNGRNNPPNVVAPNLFSTSPTVTAPIVYATASDIHAFNGFPSNPNTISSFGPNNLPVLGTTTVTGFPHHLPTAYNYRYSLDIQRDLGNRWVFTIGYQGSTGHHFTRQYDQNILAVAHGLPLNSTVTSTDWYANDANTNFNALLTDIRHQFSHSFQFEGQYRWAKSMDDASQPYYEDPYQYAPQLAWGRSDFDVRHMFKAFGVWTPTIFRGEHNWLEKVAGGWSLSGILNMHSGFPWTPLYTPGCVIVATGPDCSLRPADFLGGIGNNYSNAAFMSGPDPNNANALNRNFPNGALAYFTAPVPVLPATFPATGPLPPTSSVPRNFLNGPRYFDVDATLSKSFGLPTMPVLGESAAIEFRINAYNVFNKLNLKGGSQTQGGGINNILTGGGPGGSNPGFGQAQSALGSRTVEMEARFSF